MGLYDVILLPTDGSSGFERVVDHAGEVARVHGATVRALYVIDPTNLTGLPTETTWEGLLGVLEEQGETALEQVERRLADDIEVETTAVEGTPSREIVRAASESSVDAVVMGTHGRGGINRLLLGSVAERVVRRSPVPVITVSLRATGTAEDEPEREPATPGSG